MSSPHRGGGGVRFSTKTSIYIADSLPGKNCVGLSETHVRPHGFVKYKSRGGGGGEGRSQGPHTPLVASQQMPNANVENASCTAFA